MSIDVEKVKMNGIREALFKSVGDCLWAAKLSLESAREVENGKFKNFLLQIDDAKRSIADAERVFAEYQRAIGKK